MNVRSRLLAIWRDPVGSNVIAGLVLAAGGAVCLWVWTSVPRIYIVVCGILALSAVALNGVRRRRPVLVFLSAGGTCRDPMAKAITEKLLGEHEPKLRIDIRAAGLGPKVGSAASYAARYVIKEMYGEDLLRNHHPQLLTPALADESDLILAMDASLLLTPGKTLPPGKTYLLKTFLGFDGDVVDPWPDGKDPETLQRYRECAVELRNILTSKIQRIAALAETT